MRSPEFWTRDGLASSLLAPLSLAWEAAAFVRRALTRRIKAPVPVICVGNLVAGGAGKTPVALSLGAELIRRGRRVHFLARGYGGREAGPLRIDRRRHRARDVGDEALLLAALAPTWVARNRPAGARAAAAAGADIVVMDDGFQAPALIKDLALLVVDGGYGFGNRRVLPAGPLREKLRPGLARADAVVLIGPDTTHVASLLDPRPPLWRARLVPGPEADRLIGRRVIAFAGIGRPAKFYATLAEVGAQVIGCRDFPDHHRYTPDEVMVLCEAAAAADAVPVTTAKDWVRLPAEARPMVEALTVSVEWEDPGALQALLQSVLGHG
ncbi:MAG: tetraacyldisaccharide 4'-kinase [Kiloniellales bacterium]